MANSSSSLAELAEKKPLRESAARMFRRSLAFSRRQPLGAIGAVLLVILVILAIGAPVIAPYDPLAVDTKARFVPLTVEHPLGTDKFGRDVLSRLIFGARISLTISLLAVGAGTLVGTFLGVLSGYKGGATDLIIQRIVDVLMGFPSLLFALTIVAVLGGSMINVIIAIAIVQTPPLARVVRGNVLSVKEFQYIEAARAIGCSQLRIALIHLVPNIMAPVVIVATAGLARAILTEATLSFLGLGTPPPTPSWGADLSGLGRAYFERAPWIAIFPGLAISLEVLAVNLLGDTLRDEWDPRLRGSRH
ncbi:MAG: ABC transporter permease [Chloroflexota bacterium]